MDPCRALPSSIGTRCVPIDRQASTRPAGPDAQPLNGTCCVPSVGARFRRHPRPLPPAAAAARPLAAPGHGSGKGPPNVKGPPRDARRALSLTRWSDAQRMT
jgi:hypothetical protein